MFRPRAFDDMALAGGAVVRSFMSLAARVTQSVWCAQVRTKRVSACSLGYMRTRCCFDFASQEPHRAATGAETEHAAGWEQAAVRLWKHAIRCS